MGQRANELRTIYVDTVPVLADAGRGMVSISAVSGDYIRIMPFDVFVAYMAAGAKFIREVQARRKGATKKIIPLARERAKRERSKPRFVAETHDP